MDAPAVVALVVARRPGSWLEEALESLSDQDYPNLSVLVVAVGGAPSLEGRVAACLPDAHFASVEGTFADAANQGMEMVEGAAHVLVCHDDVALSPGAVRLLVEEAYRSNAGLTCPKFVMWGSPERLVSLGMGADHIGVVHPLVERGELDQGQHDAVREVFVAPPGAVLVRKDLWQALGGLSEGEGLNFSWRAQLAGARVVAAPRAVARHLEACPRDREAEERARFRTLWTCYSATTLLMVAPGVVTIALGESLLQLVSVLLRRHRRGGVLPAAALAGSLAVPRSLWAERRQAQALRRVSDFALWRSQSSGGARLRAALRRRAGQLSVGQLSVGHPVPDGTTAAGWSAPKDRGPGLEAQLRTEWVAAVAIALVALLIAGSRGLLSGPVPLVGQLPSAAGGIGSWWHAWWSGPGTAGLGGETFGPPGLLFMGLLGVLCFGSASLAAHVLLLGPLVVGPLGAYVGAGQFGSARGRLAAGVLYAALPVPYDAIASGHFAGLVSYAAAPWVLAGLCSVGQQHASAASWRRVAGLALLVAVAVSLAPVMLVVVVVTGLALSAGSLLASSRGSASALSALGAAGAGALAGVAAFVLLLPWSAGALWPGLSSSQGSHPGIGELLRLETGPVGGGDLGWALLVAAAVSLLIGRGWRLGQAARMWAVAFAFFALARAWSPAAGLGALMAPAGAALVYCVALGAASVEVDLSAYRFGWRQLMPAVGVAASLAAVLPLFAWAANGRWDLASGGAGAAYTFPAAPAAGGQTYRVLWVGQPGTLPMVSQGSSDGLSFAASLDGTPTASQLWATRGSRLSGSVAQDLSWALAGETSELGHLLALAGVRYIAVPAKPGDEILLRALARQVDLSEVGIDPSYAVYANAAWLPVFFGARGAPAASGVPAAALARDRWDAARLAQRIQVQPVGVATRSAGAQTPPSQSPASRSPASQSHTAPSLPSLGAIYGAVPPGTWVLHDASAKVPASSGSLGATLWLLSPSSPSAPATSSTSASSSTSPASRSRAHGSATLVLTPAGATGQHLAALATLLLWSACVAAIFRRRRRGAGAGAELVPLEAEVAPVGEDLVLVGEQR